MLIPRTLVDYVDEQATPRLNIHAGHRVSRDHRRLDMPTTIVSTSEH